MNDKNTQTLLKRYPTLFKPGFYFECHDGWFDIIDECAEKLMKHSPRSVASQVKEKWGTLRFYLEGHESVVYPIIKDAEDKSEKTCEICGEKGSLIRFRGWYYTLCPTHTSQRLSSEAVAHEWKNES